MNCCVKCGARAALLCSRCFDPYCSVTCHLRDWSDHRYACKPIPGLIKIEALLELKDGGATTNSKISDKITTSIEETLTISRPKILKELHSPVADLVKNQNHMESPVENMEDEPSITPKQDKKFPPTRPYAATSATATAASVDDHLDEMISSKPSLEISKKKVSKSSTHEKEDTSKVSRNIPPKFLKLRPLKHETSQKTVKRFFLTDLQVVPIREGKNVKLFVTDTSLLKQFLIGALDSSNDARLEMDANVQKLAEYCAITAKNNAGYKPQNDELCLAIFNEDKEWYRAFVIEKKANKDMYEVHFIDYGNISVVSSANIMPITEELMFPTCTNLCSIVKITEQNLPKLQKYLYGSTIIQGDVKYNHEADLYEVDITNNEAIFK